MYTDFYNLSEKPFDLTHSSRYLYLGEVHKEALAMLTYGVMERKGFALLTGEVGTGKTTILRAMLNTLDNNVRYVHLANPLLSPKEFMNYLTLSAFRNRITFKSKAEFLLAFEAFLTRCSQHRKYFLLVIDEAHKLSYDLLEEIRLLSNMETADEKLINIFLVGQPELNEKLCDPRCRALLQRISIRYHIKPLSLRETEEYITKRLNVAGAQKAEIVFPSGVCKAIYEYSSGFPRMINILADNLLLLGYARGEKKLTPAMVRECFEDMQLADSTPVRAPEPETMIIEKKAEPRPSPVRRGVWKWALALLLILLAAAGFFFKDEIRSGVTKVLDKYSKRGSVLPTEQKLHHPLPGKSEEKSAEKKTEETASSPLTPPIQINPFVDKGARLEVPEQSLHPPLATKIPLPIEGEREGEGGRMGEDCPPPAAPRATRGEGGGGPGEHSGGTIVVQEGDSLSKLAGRVYGRSDDDILDLILKHNPDIRSVDFIRRGQKLIFPPLPAE